MSFKIKIFCTHEKDLVFNDNPINYSICDEIVNSFNIQDDDYIDQIIIVYKTLDNFTVKSLEIFFTKELTVDELKDYLIEMYNSGFRSISNIEVDFINIKDNKILYRLSFNDLIFQNIFQRNKKYNNNSLYAVSRLYKKSYK